MFTFVTRARTDRDVRGHIETCGRLAVRALDEIVPHAVRTCWASEIQRPLGLDLGRGG